MSSISHSTIHIDFKADHRDLFRAYLHLAKWHLVAAILVSLTVVGLFIYLFILINEEMILLQTSALFIAMPLVAVGGQVLRIHATCRKMVKTIPESQREIQIMVQPTSDGYDSVRGESFSHTAWNDVMKLKEIGHCFIIWFNKLDVRIIPKHGFHQQADIPVFREIVLAKLGEKADVLDQ